MKSDFSVSALFDQLSVWSHSFIQRASEQRAAGESSAGDLITGFFGFAFVLLLLTIFIRRSRLKDAVEGQRRERAANQRLSEILAVAPDGFFRWDIGEDGGAAGTTCSRRLAILLGLFSGIDSIWLEVLESFAPKDAETLTEAAQALRSQGIGFELELRLTDERRRILVMGIRAADSANRPYADIIWMRDITEATNAFSRLTANSETLAAEHARLQAVLESLPLPVWLRDDDLALIGCNQAYARAVDMENADAAMIAGVELAPGSHLREARALAARARASGLPRSDRFRLVIEGQRRLMEITEMPLSAGGGLFTVGLAIDRTVEEDLEGQLDRHVGAQAEVLEHLSTAIAIFSADTRLVFANTAFVRLWALEPAWIESKPSYGNLLDVLREHRRLPEVADYRAYRQDELRLFQLLLEPRENLLHLPDERTLRRFVSPHPFGGLLFTYEDVTDTLALERTLTTSLAVHRATLDNLHEGVAVFSGDGRLRLSNPSYARIWHVSDADLADEPHFSDLIDRHRAFFGDSARWPGIREALLVLFAERLPRGGRLERSDGSILDYASVPLPDGAVLTTWLDVSDSARVERALRDRAEGLAAADRLKSEFMAHVSDELSVPLATILDYSELLNERHFGDLSDKQLGYVQGIAAAGRQVREVTGEILDLAAIEAGQLTLSLDFVDLNQLLLGVLVETRDRLRDKNLALDVDCPAEVGGMMADERRLRQILQTLIAHIVKLTPSGGAIRVSARREDSNIRFTITLSGADLSRERQQHLFDEIVRSAIGRDPKGTALGLSLVGRFITLHGGRIEFARPSGEGNGSITLLLPAGHPGAA